MAHVSLVFVAASSVTSMAIVKGVCMLRAYVCGLVKCSIAKSRARVTVYGEASHEESEVCALMMYAQAQFLARMKLQFS